MQPHNNPYPAPPAGRPELETALATSLARVLRRKAKFTVVDHAAGKAYDITVEDYPFPKLGTVANYMKAGPAGETCKCCGGSGVED